MQTILLILKQPDVKDRFAVDEWNEAIHTIRTAMPLAPHSAAIEEPTEGVFLLRASLGLRAFATALLRAEQKRIPYRILFVESATEWSHTPVAATTA